MKTRVHILFVLSLFLGNLSTASADDTEIYRAIASDATGSARPKVLVILDNSLSMMEDVDGDDGTRLEVAKEVVTDIIEENTGVDFGLVVFNKNKDMSGGMNNANSSNEEDMNGGRVINRIITDMSDSERATLVNMIDDLESKTTTPLCETSYEALRYLTGDSVLYGLQQTSDDSPDRDEAAEDGNGNYVSPLDEENVCQNVYIILMTDGSPSEDTDANEAIEELTGNTCDYYDDHYGDSVKNCLPVLAKYMNTTDLDNDDENGTQVAIFYTIGFTTDQELLEDVASAGGGEYYTADDTSSLTVAFESALSEIMSGASSFSSPSVAASAFNRAQSSDDMFFAMFEPENGERWPGNIKKLKVVASGDDVILADANGNDAIDSDTGSISDDAKTYWSTTVDGSTVEAGGAGQVLVDNGADDREIWTNTGFDGELETFDADNITYGAFSDMDITSASDLFDLFGVDDQTELEEVINWASGVDVLDEDDDNSTTDTRPWILGDILHSSPLVINYGCDTSSNSSCTEDIRIVAGTNEGFLHMFNNEDGSESWAFFPKELAAVLKARMDNATTASHTYAVDGAAVSYIYDEDEDGYIESSTDKVYLYFGLRRGGKAIYALDVTDPDNPSFKWMINSDTSGFSELGQTWSTPQIAIVPGYVDSDGNYKPVLIFGGGYDTGKDDHDTLAVDTVDSMGRAIFIVDADTGALVWSVTGGDIEHSIAAPVISLDSNGDNVHDRIYAADTGGNVWRVDMPTTDTSDWVLRKLAEFNGEATASDRRFFNQPDVVSTSYGYDAVLIGTGDRTNPLAEDVTNRFYAIRDKRTLPYYDDDPTSSECADDSSDFRCQMPLSESDLYDATENLIQDGDSEEQATAEEDLYSSNGWYITLEGTGEKNLGSSVTLNNIVFFTTYTPDSESSDSCVPAAGTSSLYAVSLTDASAVLDFDGNGSVTESDRVVELGGILIGTPTVYVDSSGKIRLFLPSGGTGGVTNSYITSYGIDTGTYLKAATGTYWYIKEDE